MSVRAAMVTVTRCVLTMMALLSVAVTLASVWVMMDRLALVRPATLCVCLCVWHLRTCS